MRFFRMTLLLAGLMLAGLGVSAPNAYAADKTVTVKVIVNQDFWNSKVTFPNGNKAEINGIGVVVLDKGLPQVFKTLTPGQNELTFDYTGAEGSDYQIKIPFLAGPGASVYQIIEKFTNNGQTLMYTLGVDTSIRPLTIERAQK
ncbi:hypothetical protein SDC9_74032 [bioreactor metagenome]|uniref:Uncharacterized protein n=1 Tax=bioreactor metagenome TaxID=1076179 RepID=A0A644YGE3_9ZZZZ